MHAKSGHFLWSGINTQRRRQVPLSLSCQLTEEWKKNQSWARQRRGQCIPHCGGKVTVRLPNKTCTEPNEKDLICRKRLEIPQSLMERKWDDGWVEWGRAHLANQTVTLHIKRMWISESALPFGGSRKMPWPYQTALLLYLCISLRHL